MDVGADGIGNDALVHGGLHDLNVAMDAGVTDVHDDAAVGGVTDLGADLAGVVQHVLREAVEGMGGDVAGAEVLQHVGQWYGGAADVHHEANSGLGGGFAGAGHGLVGVPASHGVVMHPYLDAEHETGVFPDGLDGLLHVDDAHVVEAAAQHAVGGQADGSDVQKGQQPGAVRRKHVVAHGAVVEETG